MKILISTDCYMPMVNGVVTSVLNLQRELLLRGHEVKILTLSQSRHSFERDGVTYIGSIGAGKIYPGARITAAFHSKYVQELVRWKPDIIHSQCEFSSFLLAHRIAKALDIPIIHTYHTVYEDYTHYFSPNQKCGRSMVAWFTRWIVDKVDCVIAPTDKVKSILESYSIHKKICVVPTGIDLRCFQKRADAARLSELKDGLGIPQDHQIMLYVGRIAKEKNIDELLRYHAKHSPGNITFLIVGDGPYRATLEAMAQALGISDSVVFAGMIAPERIAEYYQLGDLFVSASESETQGLTYIEALSSGIPALCRKDDCINDVIISGYNGWQYENEEEFAEKCKAFFADSALRREMSEFAEELANRAFSSAVFAKRVEEVYCEVLRTSSHSKIIVEEEVLCQRV